MKKKLLAPLLTIIVGVAWLFSSMKIIPEVDWFWSISLATAGILSLVFGGFNKLTIVTGPFLVTASVFSVLRQMGRISVEWEIPILIIVLGILMLISQLSKLPVPDVFKKDPMEDGN